MTAVALPPREPGAHSFIALLRHLERSSPGKPRIGRNQRLADAVVQLGQDPFLSFPANELSEVDLTATPPIVRPVFLGFYGPFGPLPLAQTEEALRWKNNDDPAFVHFTDILAARFIELFFRSWSDARAITQFDHPGDDRFLSYILASLGLGTPAFRGCGAVVDVNKARLAPLGLGRVPSAAKLSQMLRLHLGAHIDITEFVPTSLPIEPDAQNSLGSRSSTLGRDMTIGSRIMSVGEKIRIDITLPDLESYRSFLHGGAAHDQLRDVVHGVLGLVFDVDVALHLPAEALPPTRIGATAALGWTTRMPDAAPPPPGTKIAGAIYRLERAGPDTIAA